MNITSHWTHQLHPRPPEEEKSEKNRRTYEDKEYIKCRGKAIIKVKGGFFTFKSTSNTWEVTYRTLSNMIIKLTHTWQQEKNQLEPLLNSTQTLVFTIAASTSSFLPFPSIYYYGYVRYGRSVNPSKNQLRYSYIAAFDAYYASICLRWKNNASKIRYRGINYYIYPTQKNISLHDS